MISRDDIDGLVLAGGQSRRMQSADAKPVDKGLLMLQGAPLVQWVTQALQPWVSTLYISANRHAPAYSRFGVCVPDDPVFGGQAGPLAGVASVMRRSGRRWLLVSPVDVPRLPSSLPMRLLQMADEGAPVAYARAANGAHPLCMVVRCDLADDLYDYLQAGGRKVLDWHERHAAVPVDFGEGEQLFSNINTPEDWREAGGGPMPPRD